RSNPFSDSSVTCHRPKQQSLSADSTEATGYSPSKLKGGLPAAFCSECLSGLQSLHVLRLPALGAFHDVELYLLTFLQAAESARLDGGEMHEDIFAILTADESIALGIVKPLHCSCFHCVAISFFSDFALNRAEFCR